MKNIVVHKEDTYFIAFVEGFEDFVAHGKTMGEAVGNLIISIPEDFEIKIIS